MEKENIYDKPRITSTVIIAIITVLNIIFIASMCTVSWKAINDAGNGTAGDAFVVLFAAFGIVLIIFLLALTIVPNIVCLVFSIMNRHSTIKAVRIISYVFDGLISAAIVAAIVKIILLLCGI